MQLGALVEAANGRTRDERCGLPPRNGALQSVGLSIVAGGLRAKEHEMSARPGHCGMREWRY